MGERGRGSSPAVANETPPPYVSLKSRRFSAKSRFVKILFFAQPRLAAPVCLAKVAPPSVGTNAASTFRLPKSVSPRLGWECDPQLRAESKNST